MTDAVQPSNATSAPPRRRRAVRPDPRRPGARRAHRRGFGSATLVARHREYVLYTGTTPAGTPISVCSTGIGGPSASIAVEELIRVGATHFIRVGSAGGRRPGLPIGSTVVVTGAYRGDGTSLDYMPLPFPAVADLDVTLALRHAAEAVLGERALEGIVYTRDAFYRRDDGTQRAPHGRNVVAAEQECATVFVVGSLRGVKVGAVLGTDSNILLPEQPTRRRRRRLPRVEATTIAIAMRAVDDAPRGGAPDDDRRRPARPARHRRRPSST
jgi:uridine phosphorylase